MCGNQSTDEIQPFKSNTDYIKECIIEREIAKYMLSIHDAKKLLLCFYFFRK